MKPNLLIVMAETFLARMLDEQLLDTSRTGGYMTVLTPLDRTLNTPLLVAQVGKLTDPEKIEKYHCFSQEKAKRLAVKALAGHWSSWESRNPDKDKWGGAILAGNYVLSFSGLPELADEALMLGVAVNLNMISREQAHMIADISNNEIFRRLVNN